MSIKNTYIELFSITWLLFKRFIKLAVNKDTRWFWFTQAMLAVFFFVAPNHVSGIICGSLDIILFGSITLLLFYVLLAKLREIRVDEALGIAFIGVVFTLELFAAIFYVLYCLNHSSLNIPMPRTGYPFIYYSVTTFTSTGYGDILPVTGFARMFAAIEMLCGWATSTLIMALLASKVAMHYFDKNDKKQE